MICGAVTGLQLATLAVALCAVVLSAISIVLTWALWRRSGPVVVVDDVDVFTSLNDAADGFAWSAHTTIRNRGRASVEIGEVFLRVESRLATFWVRLVREGDAPYAAFDLGGGQSVELRSCIDIHALQDCGNQLGAAPSVSDVVTLQSGMAVPVEALAPAGTRVRAEVSLGTGWKVKSRWATLDDWPEWRERARQLTAMRNS